MRFAENFNPEWGYLSPAPGFMRTVRIAVVAAAVGAIAGGGVVFSLIERPEPEEASIAARTLIEPAGDLAPSAADHTPAVTTAEDRSQMPAHPHASAVVAATAQASPAVVPSSKNSVAESLADHSAAVAPAAVAPAKSLTNKAELAAPEELGSGQAVSPPETLSAQTNPNKARHVVAQQVRPASKGPLDLLRSLAARATTWPPRAD